ncbi:MAG TPA: hypothetical protein VL053_14765 [Arachidicoccus sp.]|nr:hypothetical protein [Arachidicoccus sp.]
MITSNLMIAILSLFTCTCLERMATKREKQIMNPPPASMISKKFHLHFKYKTFYFYISSSGSFEISLN